MNARIEFLLGVVIFTAMDFLDELSSFIEADHIDAIKLLYGNSANNDSIGTLPELSGFEVGQTLKQQLLPIIS